MRPCLPFTVLALALVPSKLKYSIAYPKWTNPMSYSFSGIDQRVGGFVEEGLEDGVRLAHGSADDP